MKKLLTIALTLLLTLSLAACGGDSDPDDNTTPEPTPEVQTETTDKTILESDPFPDSWIGEWVCTESGHGSFQVGEMVEFHDYKNKITITDLNGNTKSKWVYYSVETEQFLYYNQDEFVEDEYFWGFEVVKQTDTQVILNRLNSGSEVIFEKAN